MKVALIYPSKCANVSQMPLGLGYLASYILMKNDDIEVKILDTGIAREEEVKAFCNCRYDIVGFSVTSRGYNEAVELAKSFKEANKSTFIVFGGPHITILREESIQKPVIDFGIYGEGELSFNELLQVLKENDEHLDVEALGKIKGLIYRKGDKVVLNPARELIQDLDTLPFPAYHLFPMDRYPGKYPLISSRGCPFQCVFCAASRAWNGRWRARTAENVVEEVEFLLKHYPMRPIDFHDAAFNVSIKRVHDICDNFIKRKVRIPWGIRGFRADIIDTQTARKMHEAGCTQVAIGIESANPEMLIRIGKQETIEDIDKGINVLRDSGIDVLGEFMIGNPGETLETVKESIDYAINANLSEAVFGSAVPFPGTGLWHYVNEHGKFLVEPDCTSFEEVHPRVIFETPEFTREDRLQAIRLVCEAGLRYDIGPEKKSVNRLLHNIAVNVWYKHVYKHLPRLISYHLHFCFRNLRTVLRRRYLLQLLTLRLKSLIPPPIKQILRKIYYMPIDVIEKLKGRDSLTPPRSMISFAFGGRDFKKKGEEFKNYFLDLGQLQTNDRVLDIGCGVGRMAVPLTNYLSQQGEYWGFDAVRKSIKWCQNHITSRFGNFHFQHVDVYHKRYNPKGKCLAKDIQFPYQSDYFDFVFLISVFTQMLSADLENYMSEISRVLKPHGRCLITFFLLNNESEKLIHMGSSTVDFKYKIDRGLTISESVPEESIAYDEDFIRGLFEKYRLRIIEPIHYGWWCGRDTFLSYQDIILVTKE